MSNTLRVPLMLVALAVAGILLLLQFRRLLDDRSILPPDDFVEYWAAGRLNAEGKNPYDPANLLPLEIAAGRDTDEAIMMWNPPWTLTLAMPFGLMDSRVAQLLWVGLGLAFIALGADLLWRIYDGPVQQRWVSWLLAFTFMPTLFVLNAGQVGTWMLAGAVLFLFFQLRGWSMLAGSATVLLAIKPHLLYLFWIGLIVWGVCRDRRLLLGGLIAGLAATAIPLACNHQLFNQYWEAMTQRPPAEWRSPTLGTVIRDAVGNNFVLTFIPALLGLIWLCWHARSIARRPWIWRQQFPALALVSFVTASYGAWPFDLIILLPAALAVAAKIARRPSQEIVVAGVVAWLAINLLALILNILRINSFWFLWMAPMMLLAYFVLMRKLDRT